MGEADAQKYYRGYKGAALTTGIISALLSPVIGLIPAIGNSTSEINEKRLYNKHHTSPEYFKNDDYHNAYVKKAEKMKHRKIWTSYIVGSVVFVVFVSSLGA